MSVSAGVDGAIRANSSYSGLPPSSLEVSRSRRWRIHGVDLGLHMHAHVCTPIHCEHKTKHIHTALGCRAYGTEKAVGRKGRENSHGCWLIQPQAFGESNILIRSKLCVCTPGREKSRLVAAEGWRLDSVLGGSPRIMTAHMG